MSFDVAAAAYDRFMGRYSALLSAQLADLAGVGRGMRVLDVGCGPGALTAELLERVGPRCVAAVDPSEPFVAAISSRFPGVDVRRASAERLPFLAGTFDATLAQLVVHFMSDPVAGLAEMARVTRTGGVVVACVWDHAGGRTPLGPFWEAVRDLDPAAQDESRLAGARAGHLGELFAAAGLRELHETRLEATVEHASFDDWWEPFRLGVGPAGGYLRLLDAEGRTRLREACRERLPAPPPFRLTAEAWAARGVVGPQGEAGPAVPA